MTWASSILPSWEEIKIGRIDASMNSDIAKMNSMNIVNSVSIFNDSATMNNIFSE